MSDTPRGRSRFDQTEPEPARKSRFDRRSRSPVTRHDESSPSTVGGKNDAPVKEEVTSKSPVPISDPKAAAAAAAAAAARINAQLQEKLKNAGNAPKPVVAKQLPKKDSSGIYQENGDYQKDIEINHLRNRYTLTKGAFQKEVGLHFVTFPLISIQLAFATIVLASSIAFSSLSMNTTLYTKRLKLQNSLRSSSFTTHPFMHTDIGV